MDIQSLSVNMSQSRLEEEAAVRVQAMIMKDAQKGIEEAARLIETAEPISDPAKGNFLDLQM